MRLRTLLAIVAVFVVLCGIVLSIVPIPGEFWPGPWPDERFFEGLPRRGHGGWPMPPLPHGRRDYYILGIPGVWCEISTGRKWPSLNRERPYRRETVDIPEGCTLTSQLPNTITSPVPDSIRPRATSDR